MDQNELLSRVVSVLDRLGAPYMVVGSVACMTYGEPRLTLDIDMVVDLKEEHVSGLCRAFNPDEYYLSEEAVHDAIRRKSQFNIIHSTSGQKVDVMIAQNNAWGKTQIARRQRLKLTPDLECYFARPEDIILSKMLYYQEGESMKHRRDIAGILRVSGASIDRQYVAQWAERLGVTDVWQMILEQFGAK